MKLRTWKYQYEMLLVVLLVAFASLIHAEIPKTMNYQGYLKNSSGEQINDTITIKFSIWDVETGGQAALWTETLSVEVENGIYSVILGQNTPLNLPFDVPYYLGITVGTDEEMTPRQPLGSVPYALNSHAQTETDPTVPEAIKDGISWNEITDRPEGLDDGDNLGIEEETDPKVGTNVTGYLPKWTGTALEKGTIFDNGNVGIGTASPNSKLQVAGVIHSTTGGIKFPDGTTQGSAAVGGTSPWNISGSNIDFSDGNVGIGTKNPGRIFHVSDKNPILSTTTDYVVGNTGSTFVQEFGSATGNTYTLLGALTNGGSTWGDLSLQPGGNVGIGTTNPGAKLEVRHNNFNTIRAIGNSTNSVGMYIKNEESGSGEWGIVVPGSVTGPNGSLAFWDQDSNGIRMVITDTGNVGIGKIDPVSKLEVDASSDWDITISGGENTHKDLRFSDTNSGRVWQWSHRTSADNNRFQLWHHDGASWQTPPPITVLTSGLIGFKTNSPQKTLHINGDFGLGDSYTTEFPDYGYGPPLIKRFSIWDNYGGQYNPILGTMRIDDGDDFAEMAFFSKAHGSEPRALACRWGTIGTGGQEKWYIGTFGSAYFAGNIGVGTTAPSEKLHVAGNTLTEGMTTTDSLKITGGADIAEPFKIKKHGLIKPGMVVSIDPENPGELKMSEKAYDHCVAGIVSGAGGIKAGMVMSQAAANDKDSKLVALTGRAYCWCDADESAIHPGDLLTTSDTPGHAKKVLNHAKASGAIIGKAMTGLDSGKGMVLVLVALQ